MAIGSATFQGAQAASVFVSANLDGWLGWPLALLRSMAHNQAVSLYQPTWMVG